MSQMLIGQYKGQPVAWYFNHGKITLECFAGTFQRNFKYLLSKSYLFNFVQIYSVC